jgi:hypothetical protein
MKLSYYCVQINHQPDATVFQFIILTFIYSSTYFGRFPARYQQLNDCSGSLWFYLRIVVIVVLCSWSDRSAQDDPVPIVQEAGWAPGPAWRGAQNLAPHRDSIPGPSSP